MGDKDIEWDAGDEEGIVCKVEKMSDGSLTATIRVCGYVTADDKQYAYDRYIRVRLKKEKE